MIHKYENKSKSTPNNLWITIQKYYNYKKNIEF